MKSRYTIQIAAFVAALALTAVSASALEIQAPDLDPGPQLDLPGDIAPPQNGGGNGGGGDAGGEASQANGDGDAVFPAHTECPNGEMVVEFEFDSDGHPIPTSFSRTCVITN